MLNIFGIGTDIVSMSRIEKSLVKNQEKFLKRILSDREIESLPSEKRLSAYVAKRFAGKEAFSKALGLGISQGLAFNQISILNHPNGQPFIECTGKAEELLQKYSIQSVNISLSDEKDYALAFVVMSASKTG